MNVKIQRIASFGVVVSLILVVLFLNIQTGNTLWTFGFQIILVGIILNIIGPLFWLLCKNVDKYYVFSPFGLYLVYGGLCLILLGIISMVMAPVFYSMIPPNIFPD